MRRARRWVMAIGLAAALMGGGVAHAETTDGIDDVGMIKPLGTWDHSGAPETGWTLDSGVAIFTADDGVHGRELWRSEGTAAGTEMLGDLLPGAAGSDPAAFVAGDGDSTVFVAASGTDGAPELWRTDGTRGGTTRLTSLSSLDPAWIESVLPYKNGYAISYEGTTGRIAYFDGATLRDLDGITQGTGVPDLITAIDGALYYTRDHTLYRADGAGPETPVDGADYVTATAVADHALAVLAADAHGGAYMVGLVDGTRLTRIDSTWTERLDAADGRFYYEKEDDGLRTFAPGEQPRTLVLEPHPEDNWYTAGFWDLTELGNGQTLFVRSSHTLGFGLFRTDGTVGGTTEIAHGLDPEAIVPLGGGRALMLVGEYEGNTRVTALWTTDGTTGGTRRVARLDAPPEGDLLAAAGNGVIYSAAGDEVGVELYATDGTAAGTGLIYDLNRRPIGSMDYGPEAYIRPSVVGDRVTFSTQLPHALWGTDGTADGTQPLLDLGEREQFISVTPEDGGATGLFTFESTRYRTDGTPGGTAPLFGTPPPDAEPGTIALGRVGSLRIFQKPTSPGFYALMATDGTPAGTVELTAGRDLHEMHVVAQGASTELIQTFDGHVLVTDGTDAGTRDPASHDGPPYWPSYVAAIAVPGGYLAGLYDNVHGTELWHLDERGVPDPSPTEIAPGTESGAPSGFAHLAGGDDVMFAATRGAEPQWYVADPSGRHVRKLYAFEGYPSRIPGAVGGVTYFINADNDAGNYVLYATDGTQDGTHVLLRTNGWKWPAPAHFTAFGGRVYFAAGDDAHGVELWVTDGTAAGTHLARDIDPGPESSAPTAFAATRSFLFFAADDGAHGIEPWRVRAAEPAPPGGGGGGGGDAPVAIEPLPVPAASPAAAGAGGPAARLGGASSRPAARSRARVALTVRRLARGRWRVSGRVTGVTSRSGCSGTVRVVLGRGSRTLKTRTTKMKACAFSTTLTTTSRSSRRWIQVRTPLALSRRAAVR
jgi:trimeric autotransporter adhesin